MMVSGESEVAGVVGRVAFVVDFSEFAVPPPTMADSEARGEAFGE